MSECIEGAGEVNNIWYNMINVSAYFLEIEAHISARAFVVAYHENACILLA